MTNEKFVKITIEQKQKGQAGAQTETKPGDGAVQVPDTNGPQNDPQTGSRKEKGSLWENMLTISEEPIAPNPQAIYDQKKCECGQKD